MKTVTAKAKLWIHLSQYSDDEYVIYLSDMTQYGDTFIKTQEFELSFDIPEDFNPNIARVDALQAEKQKIGAEAQVQINNLDEQIQSLLAIECDS